MPKILDRPANLKPGRSNVSIYIKETDRDFWHIFRIMCEEVLEVSMSEAVLRALRFWVVHLPKIHVEAWRKSTELHFRRKKQNIRKLAKHLASSNPEAVTFNNED